MPAHRNPHPKFLKGKEEFYKKIVIKTINGGRLSWEHFCYVPVEIWEEFQKATGADGCEMGAWLAKWAKDDFDIPLGMAKLEDLETLRKAIIISYEDRYYELYSPTLGKARPPMQGLVKNWASLHMKVEAAKYGYLKK